MRVVGRGKIIGVFLEPLVTVYFVERYARLEYIHERKPLVRYGFFDYLLRAGNVADECPRHERRIHGHGHRHRVKRLFRYARNLQRCFKTHLAGRRSLSLGKPVNHVIMHQAGNVRIAAYGVNEMVAALAIHVSVAAFDNNYKPGIDGFYRGGRWHRPAMQTVEE